MTRRGSNLIEGEEMVGAFHVLMKLKILSWNVMSWIKDCVLKGSLEIGRLIWCV
jgi:hypothetical protein